MNDAITPLMYSVGFLRENRHDDGVALLLLDRPDVDVNRPFRHTNTTVLIKAVEGNLPRVVRKLLLRPELHINSVDVFGNTALRTACKMNRTEIAAMILDERASDVEVNRGAPLVDAAVRGHAGVVRMLLDAGGIDANVYSSNGFTALAAAALRNELPAARLLLDAEGINANIGTPWGGSPLLTAAAQNSRNVFELLLKHPAVDVNLPDTNGTTPLMAAASLCLLDIARSLLDRSEISVNSATTGGRTALFAAADSGCVPIISMLVARPDCEVDKRDALDGATPLHRACSRRTGYCTDRFKCVRYRTEMKSVCPIEFCHRKRIAHGQNKIHVQTGTDCR